MDACLQWIVQGGALAVLVTAALGRWRAISASLRYRVWWATLAAVLLLPVVDTTRLPGAGALLDLVPLEVSAAAAASPGGAAVPLTWAIAMGAIVWMAAGLFRIGVAFARLDAAKRAVGPFPLRRERELRRWRAVRNRGRRATLVVSDHVAAAGVLGLGYPRIAVNPGLVAQLTDAELDQVIVHEHAHVQRRDDLAAAIQLAIRALVGWHPAVWWIDRRLSTEREVACDDAVVGATGAPAAYARCLARVAEVCGRPPEAGLAPGGLGRSQLARRLARLLTDGRNTSTRVPALASAIACAALAAAAVGLAGRQPAADPGVDATASPAPLAVREPATPPPMAAAEPRRLNAASRVAPVAAAREPVPPAAPVTPATVVLAAVSWVEPTVFAASLPAVANVPPPASSAVVDAASPIATGTTADADAAMQDEDALSWKDGGRLVARAGVMAGRSIAGAGASAGGALAAGGQKAALTTARLFSRLGKRLAHPF